MKMTCHRLATVIRGVVNSAMSLRFEQSELNVACANVAGLADNMRNRRGPL